MDDDDNASYSLLDDIPEDCLLAARIEIVRFIKPDGSDEIYYQALDSSADVNLPLVELLGMLRITESIAIHERLA